MITVVEARAAIARALEKLDATNCPVRHATGRILRQEVFAERDQPPFDRVTMDGIAIRYADYDKGTRSFRLGGVQHAGDAELDVAEDHCIEIMTGASLPTNADCVIPVEDLLVTETTADIVDGTIVQRRQYVHPRGSDHKEGSVLLRPGKRIQPTDIAILESAGLENVEVSRMPVIRVISTGNELVPAGQDIAPHQIRLSNGPALVAMLEQHGFSDTEHLHLRDDPDAMREAIAEQLASADVLVLSGGVSKGKADFVPDVLAELGVEVKFHRISQRPGKPMWFGVGPEKQAVFALPGNPVSTLVCCRQYVIPALYEASGGTPIPPEFASLGQPVHFRPDLTCFLPARIVSNAAGQLLALPVTTNTSGDFTALSGTDGYVELSREQQEFPAGTIVPLHRWQHP